MGGVNHWFALDNVYVRHTPTATLQRAIATEFASPRPNIVGDDTSQMKRKLICNTSYEGMTIQVAEKQHQVKVIPIDTMSSNIMNKVEGVDVIERRVYERIPEFPRSEGYPDEGHSRLQ